MQRIDTVNDPRSGFGPSPPNFTICFTLPQQPCGINGLGEVTNSHCCTLSQPREATQHSHLRAYTKAHPSSRRAQLDHNNFASTHTTCLNTRTHNQYNTKLTHLRTMRDFDDEITDLLVNDPQAHHPMAYSELAQGTTYELQKIYDLLWNHVQGAVASPRIQAMHETMHRIYEVLNGRGFGSEHDTFGYYEGGYCETYERPYVPLGRELRAWTRHGSPSRPPRRRRRSPSPSPSPLPSRRERQRLQEEIMGGPQEIHIRAPTPEPEVEHVYGPGRDVYVHQPRAQRVVVHHPGQTRVHYRNEGSLSQTVIRRHGASQAYERSEPQNEDVEFRPRKRIEEKKEKEGRKGSEDDEY